MSDESFEGPDDWTWSGDVIQLEGCFHAVANAAVNFGLDSDQYHRRLQKFVKGIVMRVAMIAISSRELGVDLFTRREAIDIRPGDTIVFKTDFTLSLATYERLTEQLNRLFPEDMKIRCILLDKGLDMEVMRRKVAPEAIAAAVEEWQDERDYSKEWLQKVLTRHFGAKEGT